MCNLTYRFCLLCVCTYSPRPPTYSSFHAHAHALSRALSLPPSPLPAVSSPRFPFPLFLYSAHSHTTMLQYSIPLSTFSRSRTYQAHACFVFPSPTRRRWLRSSPTSRTTRFVSCPRYITYHRARMSHFWSTNKSQTTSAPAPSPNRRTHHPFPNHNLPGESRCYGLLSRPSDPRGRVPEPLALG